MLICLLFETFMHEYNEFWSNPPHSLSSVPLIPLPAPIRTPCPLLLKPLNPLHASCMCMGREPSTEAWVSSQDVHPGRKLILPSLVAVNYYEPLANSHCDFCCRDLVWDLYLHSQSLWVLVQQLQSCLKKPLSLKMSTITYYLSTPFSVISGTVQAMCSI